MSRQALGYWCFICVLLAAASPGGGQAAEATPAGGAEAGRLEFGRVYVPADQMEAWPRGNTRFLPVEAREFERLLGVVRAATSDRPKAAAIAAAEYRARLEGSRLVDGKASLQVVLPGGHSATVSLEPCGVAIEKAFWAGQEEKAAVWGLDADGRLRALVSQAGQLVFDWSLAGSRDQGGTITFALEVPDCPATRLILELPGDRILQCDQGIVFHDAGAEASMRRWRIELGAHHRVQLQVVPTGSSVGRPEAELSRQSLVYDLSERGMELSAELQLNVAGGSLHELSLALDPGLQLVSACSGEQLLNWSAASDPRLGTTRVELRLPEPIAGSSRVIRLGALAKLTMDRPWRLPGIRVEDKFWREGNATVLVSAPLLVTQVRPLQAQQSKMGTLAAPSSGESLEFQYFQPDSGVEIVLTHPGKPLQVDSGTAVELDGGGITARTIADFRVAEGERFVIEAALAGSWSIDSVESIPGSVLDDWTWEKAKEEGASDTAEPVGQKLVIRLARAITPSQPVRLVITGRCLQSPVGRELAVGDVTPLRFPPGTEGKRLVAVKAVSPYWFQLSGAEQVKRLDVKSLDSSQLALFSELPRDLLFANDAQAERLRISLKAQRPRYSAAAQVDATVGDRWLAETYRLHCVPEGARVDRVLVYFSGPRQGPLQWAIEGTVDSGLRVRQLSAEEQTAAEVPSDGETWEVALQRASGTAFDIRATRTIPLAGAQSVSLVALPEATSQHGTLVVRETPPSAVRLENRRLTPIPATPVPPDQYHSDRATYRYDPAREMAAGAEAAVVIHLEPQKHALPSAWIWSCQVDSLYAADGTGQHLATYRLQNSGRRELEVAVPPETTEVRAVWVELAQTTWKTREGQPGKCLVIELPTDVKYPVVAVQFLTAGRPLGVASTIRPPLPEADVPTLTRLETIWLPPGYEAVEPDLRWQAPGRSGLSWSQRLLGPLGRPAENRPFDPVAIEDWWSLVGYEPGRASADQRAGQLLEALGASFESNESGTPEEALTWGALLSQGAAASLGQRVLVDQQALARAGIWPWTRVAAVQSGQATAGGTSRLQDAGLAILVHPNAILITSTIEIALNHANLSPVEGKVVWNVLPGPLGERIAGASGEDPALVAVESWVCDPIKPRFPWPAIGQGVSEPIQVFGWSASRMESPSAALVRLSVVHRASMRLLGWITFLAVIGLAWWKAADRVLGLVVCAGFCGVLALLVPTAYQPIASGAFLGFGFCLLLPLVYDGRTAEDAAVRRSRSWDTSFQTSQAARLGAVILVITATLAFCHSVLGDEARPSPSASGAAVHRVLIPVDQQQEPTGGKYYVSEPLYTELYRRAAAVEKPQGWLLRGATYRGVLAWQAAPERIAPVQFKASFELQVFGRVKQIRLPLGQKGVDLAPEGVTLDGRAVAVQWTSTGEAIVLDAPEPGSYRLEVALEPATKVGSNGTRFEFAIPRLPNSRLELSLPRNAPVVEVPSALGAVARDEVASQLTAELGPTDRLRVSWQEDTQPGTGPTLDVDELLWLRIQPGSVVLDARFCVKVVKGRIHRLRLLADPQLQLLPPEGNGSPVKEIHAGLGQPQTLRLDLAKPVDDQVTFKLSFLLKDTVGVGNLKLPQLEMADSQVTKRWMALSVDPALRYEEHPGEAKPVAVPDFAGAWGVSESQPDSARDLAGESASAWSVSTCPRPPRIVAYQEVTLSYGAANVSVQLDAHLITSAGYRFQYRLAVPRELEVNQVSVLAEDVERVARWSRTPEGSLIVFLTGPVAGQHSLSLRGTMPVSVPGRVSLPVLRIEDCELGSSAVAILRQPSVLVGVKKVVGMEETEPLRLDRGPAGQERVVKSYIFSGSAPASADLVLTTNRPTLRAEQVTALRPKGEAWEAVAEVDVAVAQGVLDDLCLEVPVRFAGPYSVDPPATVRVLDTPGRPRRLVIRPRAEVTDRCHFRIIGFLTTGPGDPASVPGILVEQAEQTRQVIVLPSKREGRAVRWETQGLKQVTMPKDRASLLSAAFSPIAYEVTAKDYRAVLESADRQGGAARVSLADIQVAWQADGSCHGTASFDLDPVGRSLCPLRIPAGLHPVQVSVAGVPVTPLPERRAASADSGKTGTRADEPSGQYNIPLCSTTLPQRIEVVFIGGLPTPPSGRRLRFDAPGLGSIPVDQTLWTIYGPSSCRPKSAAGATRTSEAKQELLRLSSIIQLIEPVSTATTEEPETLLHWYDDWAGHLDASRDRLHRLLALAGAGKLTYAENQLSEIEARQARIADLLRASPPSGRSVVQASLACGASELWESTLLRSEEVARYVSASGDCLVVDVTRMEAGGISGRLLSATVLGVLVILGVLAVRRGMLPGPLCRWPHLCGVAAGLAWWLWLSPSILGWVIVAVSVISSFRPGWRAYQQPDSAIIPLRLSK